MKNRKPGVYMEDGEFVYHPDGSMVDICSHGNCRQPCEQGWIACPKHKNTGYPGLEKHRQNQQLLKLLRIK